MPTRLRPAAALALASVVFVVVRAQAVAAQCLNPFLGTSASTRALAMGDANTAGRDDDVVFYSPAQLAVARGTSVAAERYGEHVTSATVASTSRIGSGGIGVGVTLATARNGSGCSILVFPPSGTPFPVAAPENFGRALVAAGVAQTYKRFRVGVTGKYATRQIGDVRASHWLADVGVGRDIGLADRVSFGAALAVQNIGPNADDAMALQTPLRSVLGGAAGLPLGPLDIVLAAQGGLEQIRDLAFPSHARGVGGGGAEVGYTWLDGYSLALRAGLRTPPELTDLRRFTAGAGLALDRIAIDYAAESLVGSRFAHRIGVRLR